MKMTLVYLKINLQVEHILISVQWFHMKTHFDTEPRGNLELATLQCNLFKFADHQTNHKKTLVYPHCQRLQSWGTPCRQASIVTQSGQSMIMTQEREIGQMYMQGNCMYTKWRTRMQHPCPNFKNLSNSCQNNYKRDGEMPCQWTSVNYFMVKNRFLSFCKLLQGEKCVGNLTVI